jgi:class 3 adenylate cyclase/type II secretory pathway pseudopilin PulG
MKEDDNSSSSMPTELLDTTSPIELIIDSPSINTAQLQPPPQITTKDEDSSQDTSSTLVLKKRRQPVARIKRLLRKLLSINVIFTLVIVIALILAITAVVASSLFSSRTIVLNMSAKLRETLALQATTSVTSTFDTSNRNMEVAITLFDENWDSLRDVYTNSAHLDGVVNIFRSIVITDPNNLHLDVIFDDGSSITYDTLATFYYVLYVSSSYSNFTADVSVFNQSNPDSTVPLFKVKIPGWIATAPKNSFWKLANAYNGQPEDYILSRVWTNAQTNGNVFAISRKLYYPYGGAKYGVLSSVYTIDLIESRLQASNPSNSSFILITDSFGSFVACTLPYPPIIHSVDGAGDYKSISETNHTELIAMEHAVNRTYGGWEALHNRTSFSYNSPDRGKVIVQLEVVQYPNREWYVLVAWPETAWTDRVNKNTGMNIGIALAVLVASVVITLCFSIPVTRSIHQIKECFNKIREMDLDANVINKTVKSRYLWYETSELQSSFKSMLSTLKSFQKYVPAYVVHRVVHKGLEASLGVKPEKCTVFFLDIKDFTRLSEELNPRVLVELMGEAFENLSKVIDNNDGVIDKYIGDCIMAFWQNEEHELKACKCAVECMKALRELSESLKSRQQPPLECRIGINSGSVLLGNFGSTHRYNYTVIGDNVNLASRVEGLNKQYDSGIIITENTCKTLRPDTFLVRRLERVQVKGREQSTLVYELMKSMEEATPVEKENVKLYESAMEEYFAGNFQKAQSMFEQIPNSQEDPVIVKKVKQCIEYQEVIGDGSEWSGIVRMDLK